MCFHFAGRSSTWLTAFGKFFTFAPIQCYLGWSYYQRFAFYMSIPAVVLVLPLLVLMLL